MPQQVPLELPLELPLVAAKAARISVGPLRIDAPEEANAWWVLDGQQRLTALTAGTKTWRSWRDAHLKNWSLIYPDRVQAAWSPLYDQVATVAWRAPARALEEQWRRVPLLRSAGGST